MLKCLHVTLTSKDKVHSCVQCSGEGSRVCTFEDGVSSGIFTPVTKILENQLVAISPQTRRKEEQNIVEVTQ